MTPGSVETPYRKSRGHSDTDILLAQRTFQVYVDRHRCEVEVRIALDHRPDKCSTTVDTLG